jgi:Protein of unknown function (DUF2380)
MREKHGMRRGSAAAAAAAVVAAAGRVALLAALACILCNETFAAEASDRPTIAVLDFDYLDSSGEPTDQTAIHRAQLVAFMRSIRSDLESHGRYRVVPLTCDPDPCSTDVTEVRNLVATARAAGVHYVLLGGFHKVSTLVQWARAQVIDVTGERLAFDRLLSFRGDNDKAWQRTEAFLMEQLVAADLDHSDAPAK